MPEGYRWREDAGAQSGAIGWEEPSISTSFLREALL